VWKNNKEVIIVNQTHVEVDHVVSSYLECINEVYRSSGLLSWVSTEKELNKLKTSIIASKTMSQVPFTQGFLIQYIDDLLEGDCLNVNQRA